MLRVIVLGMSSILCGTAFADAPGGDHLLLGTWSVDVAQVQQPNPPKSVTLTLEKAEADAYHIAVTIESPDGSKVKSEGTFKPDGNAVKVTGNQDFDVVSMTMPTKRMLVMGGGFAGHPASTRVWSLADDGKQMIETAIRYLPDGTPYQRVITWSRK